MHEITVHELAGLLAGGGPVHLVDVREAWEHETAALPGSQLLPLSELSARLGELAPPPGALVVAYCHHGVRSLRAAAILAHAGVEPVASLRGGIDAWSLAIDPRLPRY